MELNRKKADLDFILFELTKKQPSYSGSNKVCWVTLAWLLGGGVFIILLAPPRYEPRLKLVQCIVWELMIGNLWGGAPSTTF